MERRPCPRNPVKAASKTLLVLDHFGREALLGQRWEILDPTTPVGDPFAAIVLTWPRGDDGVAVSFSMRDHQAWVSREPGKHQSLSFQLSGDALLVRANDHTPLVVDLRESAARRQLGAWIQQVSRAGPPESPRWPGRLDRIGALARLIAGVRRCLEAPSAHELRRGSTAREITERLHHWLDETHGCQVKIEQAAEKLGLNARQLARQLKEASGAGFSEHYGLHRLIRARAMLQRSVDSVQGIGRATGFNSREHFIRSFRRAFGWTPLQFRKAWNSASLAHAELVNLCRLLGRDEVRWTPVRSGEPGSTETPDPHTLVVANALDEVVELFWIDGQRRSRRIAVLEHGAMVFVPHDHHAERWTVRVSSDGRLCGFETGGRHSFALVTPDRLVEAGD